MKNTVSKIENSNVVRGEFKRGIVTRAIDMIKSRYEQGLATRHLNALSDRMLKDIGIERFEISEAVRSNGAFASLIATRAPRPELYTELRRAA